MDIGVWLMMSVRTGVLSSIRLCNVNTQWRSCATAYRNIYYYYSLLVSIKKFSPRLISFLEFFFFFLIYFNITLSLFSTLSLWLLFHSRRLVFIIIFSAFGNFFRNASSSLIVSLLFFFQKFFLYNATNTHIYIIYIFIYFIVIIHTQTKLFPRLTHVSPLVCSLPSFFSSLLFIYVYRYR